MILTNYSQDIKQINYVCPGYTVHIPPSLSGYALELRVVYEWYILGNHSLSITNIIIVVAYSKHAEVLRACLPRFEMDQCLTEGHCL